MKKFLFPTSLVLIFIALFGCSVRYRNPDPFYSSTGEWDSIRFPLIKPYQVTYHEQSPRRLEADYWGIQLHVSPMAKEIYWYTGLHDVQKIAVVEGVILVYTPYEPLVAKDVGQKVLNWFVIIPDKGIETGFDNENDFLEYLQEYGINEVSWETPDVLYQRFLDTGCLDWIPGCQ